MRRYRLRKERVIKSYVYNGWRLEIIEKNTQAWRYEWRLTALKQSHIGMMKWHGVERTIADPTSHRTVAAAIYFGKCAANEMRQPRLPHFPGIFLTLP